MRFFSIFLFSAFCSYTLYAQQTDSIQHNLKEIEVSATLKPSTTRSATPLQVLTEKDFTLQGIQSVSDAVKRFNGVVLKDYGGIGGLKTVSIRGMGAEYTAISYDGMIVSNSQSGQVDIGRFTLDNISMLSLSIGQDDNIFQTAKSFASVGVLNLQTKRPSFISKRYNLQTKVSSGSFGYFEPMIDFSYKLSNKTVIAANVNWQRADGHYPFVQEDDHMLTNRKRKNSDTNIFRTEVNLYNKLSDKDNLDIKLYYFNSERGLPGSVVLYYDDSSDRLWDNNAFAQITYDKKFDSKWKWKSIAKYDYYYQKYRTDIFIGGGDTKNSYNRYRQNEVYWSNMGQYKVNPYWLITLSQDLVFNSLRSSFASFNDSRSEPDRYSNYTALAVQYRVQRFSITGSGLYNYIYEKIENKDKKNIYRKLSPAFSTSLQPFESNNLRLRASYKHVYRVPTFSEAYFVNTDRFLKPESSSQYNIGATWAGSINNSPFEYINMTVDAYYNDVNDKIIIIPTMFIPIAVNMGKVKMKGIDTKLSTNIRIVKGIYLDITGAYSYMYAYDNDERNEKTYKGQLPYTPKHSGSASLTLRNPWVNLSYTVLAAGLRYTKAENIPMNEVKSYTDHSITASKEIKVGKYKLYGIASLLNILNKNYDIIAYYPMPRRSFKISIGCKF